jgi:hypothetical protein
MRHGSGAARRAMVDRPPLSLLLGLSVMAAASCGSPRSITVVNDISVSFDAPTDRLPVDPANARLAAAAREVRELLGHPLSIALDVSLAPEYRDGFDGILTSAFEQLATELEKARKRDEPLLRWARQKLTRIVVHYAPGASRDELVPRWDTSGAVLVTVDAKARTLIPVADILWLLRESAEKEQAAEFARQSPETIPTADHATYVKWLRGSLDPRGRTSDEERQARELGRIGLAIRFARKAEGAENRQAVLRFLIDTALRDLAWERYGRGAGAVEASRLMAVWLERDFESLPAESRAQTLDTLLGRGVKNARLLECAFMLAVRAVDAWRSAGHPLPGEHAPSIPREFEVVVCPHPKNERDTRSLAPRCEGGIVRLALATEPGRARLGELLASRKDPILVEHVMVSAGYSTYEGGEGQGFALLRAVEADPPSLRMALRVLAEEHAHGAVIDVWMAEMRRLWLARPGARGTILYVLAHLDPYGNGKVDFADFAGDFGALVSAEEAKAYFSEGYRALSLAHIVWPALHPDFSRAAILRPLLDGYLADDRVDRFAMRDPHEALVRIRHRLCEEGAEADLRTLSSYFAARVKERPGQGLDDMSKSFDPKTCDPRRGTKRPSRATSIAR